jgi:hypothetical protein
VFAVELDGVVITVAAQRVLTAIRRRYAVPLFAGDLTRLAADAN